MQEHAKRARQARRHVLKRASRKVFTPEVEDLVWLPLGAAAGVVPGSTRSLRDLSLLELNGILDPTSVNYKAENDFFAAGLGNAGWPADSESI